MLLFLFSTQFLTSFWGLLVSAKEFASMFFVIQLEAATRAFSPISTGATRTVLEPIETPFESY